MFERFEVGETVKVRGWDEMLEKYGYAVDNSSIDLPMVFIEEMKKYCGKTFKVKEYHPMGYLLDTDLAVIFDRRALEKADPLQREQITLPYVEHLKDYGVWQLTYRADIDFIFTKVFANKEEVEEYMEKHHI